MYFIEHVHGSIWFKPNQSVSVGDVPTGKVADLFVGSDDTTMTIDDNCKLFVIRHIGAGTLVTVQGKYGGKAENIDNCILVGTEEVNVRDAVFIGKID